MSKSLKRVSDALGAAGLQIIPVEMADGTRTAADAAAAVGCDIDQIAKSIVLQGATSGRVVLFVTPGGRQVDLDRAAQLAGEPLGRADAAAVRAQTGFAIGGVSPVGHLTPVTTFFDAGLSAFAVVWAAAGTPRHVFAIAPDDLARISGAVVAEFAG
ncbi:Cys-tRNA(Pro) deacylase, prolyl-tRNA editing enzyme YbaK/EbsC [Loktanella fryxellensis]|uniref:Cys-tRNA(Pro) deacylase, prolyl-tRNA editing enzyme YbaK/EbsC n=1 Tax=Loktanella fryxellensis TaxID=245187 RepID=A0A1H7YD40_9RHOB|nr:YbaK/EbsC family protein [Loktanella fryxellensis]SEM43257.1 Cys-tRNA(Pro) deacylase, prolyl-tRNA editing enzyme YbaK/EbsC [Loktanella fryxellensis]